MSPAYIVFVGTFVHLPRDTSKALAIQQGALWVATADGRIKGTDWTVVTEGDIRALLKEKGWVPEDASRFHSETRVKIVRAREEHNEFFFPGFIGRCWPYFAAFYLGMSSHVYNLVLRVFRYPYPCSPVSEQWALWLHNSPRLAKKVYFSHGGFLRK
jgi:hypothetical protein